MSVKRKVLLALGALVVVVIGGASLFWWAFVPHPVIGAEAFAEARKSFDADFPSAFTYAVAVRSVFGPGTVLVAEPDSQFVIGILKGLNERQSVAAGYDPDSDPPANWVPIDSLALFIRGQQETVYRYSGVRSDGVTLRGWVVKFVAKDGIVKISIMGLVERFDDKVALTFLESIR